MCRARSGPARNIPAQTSHAPGDTANRNPADKLASELNGVRLFEGRITDVERRTEGGFARGQAIIQGLEAYQGRSMKLNFQKS